VSAWLESFLWSTFELLLDVVDKDGGTTCAARNETYGRDALVAGCPRLVGGREKVVGLPSSDGHEAFISAVLGKGHPFYDYRGAATVI
jgi:hypothetical protein